MAEMKKLLLLALSLALLIGCTTWYKGNIPKSEVPKAERELDQNECEHYATLECSKVHYLSFNRCRAIQYYECMSKRGWHKK